MSIGKFSHFQMSAHDMISSHLHLTISQIQFTTLNYMCDDFLNTIDYSHLGYI
jgi:hypothetical protein